MRSLPTSRVSVQHTLPTPNSAPRRAPRRGAKTKLHWKVEVARLDYHHYLPIFASGLREVEEPFRFIAEHEPPLHIEAAVLLVLA